MSNGLGGGLLGLGLAFLVAVALVPLGIRLAWRFGVVDHPVGNKIHARPTPLMGGAAKPTRSAGAAVSRSGTSPSSPPSTTVVLPPSASAWPIPALP